MRRLTVLAVCGGVTSALLAPAVGSPRPAVVAEDDGLVLLRLSAAAGATLTYSGTQVVSSWSPTGASSAVIDLMHAPGSGFVLRVEPTAASPGGTVFRPTGEDNVGPTAALLELVAASYDAAVEGTGRVAGRAADVVVVRTDSGTPVARFWLDRQTRLALRRQVLDSQGRALRESAFLDISYSASALPQLASVAQQLPAPTGESLQLDAVDTLRDAGWHVPSALPPTLRLYNVRVERKAPSRVHLTYADGLSTVSVFQQRGRLATDAMVGSWRKVRMAGDTVWMQDAFPRRVAWSSRGTVYTVVAECPDTVLESVVAALPHGEPRRGVLARLGRGIARVGSWFNPFA